MNGNTLESTLDSPSSTGLDNGGMGSSYFDNFDDGMHGSDQVLMAHPEQNMAVIATLISLIVILCIILGFVSLPPLIHMIRRKIPVSQERINKRFETIDGWLITKKVHAHDAACDSIRLRYGKNTETERLASNSTCISGVSVSSNVEIDTTTSKDTKDLVTSMKFAKQTVTREVLRQKLAPAADSDTESNTSRDGSDTSHQHGQSSDEERECPICLEPFRAGDRVSWSSNSHCGHVFHHRCLREWLLRRIGCPCCRLVVLPVDRQFLKDPSRVEDRASESHEQGSVDSSLMPSSRENLSHGISRRISASQASQYASERAIRASTTYFCSQDGLVTLHGLCVHSGLCRGNKKTRRKSREVEEDPSASHLSKQFEPDRDGDRTTPGRSIADIWAWAQSRRLNLSNLHFSRTMSTAEIEGEDGSEEDFATRRNLSIAEVSTEEEDFPPGERQIDPDLECGGSES